MAKLKYLVLILGIVLFCSVSGAAQYEATINIVVNPDGTFTPVLPPISTGEDGMIDENVGGLRGWAPGEYPRIIKSIAAGVTKNLWARVYLESTPAKMVSWHNDGHPVVGILPVKMLDDDEAKEAEGDLTGYIDDPVDWEWRMYLFVYPPSKLTAQCIADFQKIYADHGAIEIPLTNRKYSASGELPVAVYGTTVLATAEMRDDFADWFATYLVNRTIVAAEAFNGYQKNEIVVTNFPGLETGGTMTAKEMEALFMSQFNMQLIQ